MVRLEQAVLIASASALSWLLMSAVHEFGHVLGAVSTGGTVERVVLHPLAISRTDVRPNPQPLIVVWSGPIVGIAVPLAAVAVCRRLYRVIRDLVSFFAGACLIANGLYLSVGSFYLIGDAGELLRHGAAAWHLWLFGAATVPLGLWLWSGTGPTFGFGAARGHVSRPATWICAAVALAIAAVEIAAVEIAAVEIAAVEIALF
jgi:hypothetical protein